MTEEKGSSDWRPQQYLKFGDERTQPAIDLAMRIEAENPSRIIDIGCGPGNSTDILKRRWPKAHIIGMDSSEAMLDKARTGDQDIEWVHYDVSADLSQFGQFDIVFSNAVLQWVPDLPIVTPRLFRMLRPGGALGIQVPYAEKLPSHVEMQKLFTSTRWKRYFDAVTQRPHYHSYDYYYEILSNLTKKLFIWQTDYVQIMRGYEDIVEWNKGSSLRPFLDILPDDRLSQAFMEEYGNAIRHVYKSEKDGSVLYPFTRIFILAYQNDSAK